MSPFPAMTTPAHPKHLSQGGRPVDALGAMLPLKSCSLEVDARGGIARVILEQRFENPHDVALTLTYKMPLPADAAVSGYSFDLDDRRIEGEVDKKKKARERYEEALADGRSAALLEQARPDLFVQEIGNIPPRSTVVARLVLDQKLRWLDEGRWEWRFPLASAPRYLGPSGVTPDAAKVTLDVAEHGLPARAKLALAIRDTLTGQRSPESPSHAINVHGGDVELGDGGLASLDRDVVVRWEVASAMPGASIALARPGDRAPHAASAYGLVTLVPPQPKTKPRRMPRDLIMLLDTSGSMHGVPIEQAKRVCCALIDSLTDDDQLEMVEFSSRPNRFKKKAQHATEANKKKALRWVSAMQAGGATEMVQGILEATKTLRDGAQRQIVLITDGLIGFETEIVKALSSKLPATCRLHTVGVGSAVNRSLLGSAARAGRGVEVIIGLGEDPERACQRILARTEAPLVVNIEIEGDALRATAPVRIADLYAGAPALVAIEVDPRGGKLRVRGETPDGPWTAQLTIETVDHGQGSAAIPKLFARERVEDIELDIASGEGRSEQDLEIETLGVRFQIATRLTSWVAISSERSVDPLAPSRRETVPQSLPHGMSAEGLGLRAPMAMMPAMQRMAMMPMAAAAPAGFAGGRARSRGIAPGAAAPPGGPPPGNAPAPPASPPPPYDGPAYIDFEAGDELSELDELEVAAPQEQVLPKKRSIMARVTDKLTSWLGDEDEPADEAAELAKGAASADSRAEAGELPHRTLVGHITLQKDGKLVLEFDVDSELDWDASVFEAQLGDAEGTLHDVTIAVDRSTRAGHIAAGLTVRLVLELEARRIPITEWVELILESDSMTLTIELTK